MSMFRRAMDYLGLGPDDVYDDYDASIARERPARRETPTRQVRDRRRVVEPNDDYDDDDYEDEYVNERTAAPRRAVATRDDSSVRVRPVGGSRQAPTVRPLPVNVAEPVTIRPTRFDQAKEIADHYREGQPVIMNLGSADADTARRLLDFVSGLVYVTAGVLEKVAAGVFLIKPQGARDSRD
jgi:cell division inhibitor SepF